MSYVHKDAKNLSLKLEILNSKPVLKRLYIVKIQKRLRYISPNFGPQVFYLTHRT